MINKYILFKAPVLVLTSIEDGITIKQLEHKSGLSASWLKKYINEFEEEKFISFDRSTFPMKIYLTNKGSKVRFYFKQISEVIK